MTIIMDMLESVIATHKAKIADWFVAAYKSTPPCFYSSVDLRHSAHKLVPVDTNLFPAGFNHLSEAARKRAKIQIQHFIAQQDRPIKKIMILPENHTRNIGYLENLIALQKLFLELDIETIIGSMDVTQLHPLTLPLPGGSSLVRHPSVRVGNKIETKDSFAPDMIVVNNDLSSGAPDLLKGVTQLIVPQTGLGWYRRKKSIHFDAYLKVAKLFAEEFTIDWWRIAAIHHQCGLINFRERKGVDCVALGVEKVLRQVRERYKEYNITEDPYVFIKADSGTYGMGIMTVRSGEEVVEMNKKSRNKMNIIKEGVQSSEVIIQEGIPTVDKVADAAAEPMIYCVNGYAVGGAFRTNQERGIKNNLNAAGMQFVGMCDDDRKDQRCPKQVTVPDCNFDVYSVLSQLATLAAAREEYGEMYYI